MNDLKTRFDTAMGEPPPSRIDVDHTIRRMRNKARFRRAGAGAGMMSVVIAAAFVLQPLLVRNGQTPDQNNPPAVVLPSPSIAPTEGDRISAQITAAAKAKLKELLPGATLTGFEAVATQYRELPEVPWGQIGVEGFIQRGTVPGWLNFTVGRTHDDPGKVTVCSAINKVVKDLSECEGESHRGRFMGDHMYIYTDCAQYLEDLDTMSIPRLPCTERTGPNGETIVILPDYGFVADDPASVWKQKELRVEVMRTDGTNVVFHALGGPVDKSSTTPGPRPEPPLDADQIIALALTPGLSIKL